MKSSYKKISLEITEMADIKKIERLQTRGWQLTEIGISTVTLQKRYKK